MQTKKCVQDGVEYELITPEMVARDGAMTILVNPKTGEKRAMSPWEHELGSSKKPLPPGWKIDASGKSAAWEERGKFMDEITTLFERHGAITPVPERDPRESNVVRNFHADHFIAPNGKFDSYYCVTARRDGKLIGVISFRIDKKSGGDKVGYLDVGVIAKESRYLKTGEERPEISTSDFLMRLVIAALVKDFNCRFIETVPVSGEGQKFNERNGFKHTMDWIPTEHKEKRRQLDRRVMDKIRELTRNRKDGREVTWKDLPEIIREITPVVEMIKREIDAEKGVGMNRR